MTSNLKVEKLSQELIILEKNKKFEDAEIVAKTLVGFFSDAELNIRPFRSNKLGERTKNWFHPKPGHGGDLPCTLEIVGSSVPIDFKLFWTKKTSKQIIAGITNFSSNYEDSPIYEDYNIGIDIIVPNTTDRVIIVLTNKYVLRTLELHGKLTATQQEILHKWTQEFDFGNKKLLHEILWQGFNIKSLNKKFYESIVATFTALVQHLGHSGLDLHESRQFTNRLIGRVVFCWFLRKKNIISEKFDYFTIQEKDSTEYYNQILSKLFFSTLNLPIEERGQIIRNLGVDKETPYLNGGLFERKGYDSNENIIFPERFFHEFFDFLSEYNFTTDESTSTYQQVAVDPEMLGRIFENLLAEQNTETGEQARKAKGAFYTPREIVDYICKEALKTHLIQKLNAQQVPETDIDKILEQLFIKSDSEYALYSKNAGYDVIQSKHRGKIIDILDNIKVIDPACGSGAFPMGMMQTILQCYERILPETKFDPVETKKNIIEECLFGVDIDPMAVEISRLRSRLSIIVDEVNESKIEPLPNLDFKFICANSLVGLTSGYQQLSLSENSELKQELNKLRHKYYKARTPKSKNDIKNEYENLLRSGLFEESSNTKLLKSFNVFDASKSAGFFDPEYMFGEELFDIVIGNPPYVSYYSNTGSKLTDEFKDVLVKNYEHIKKTNERINSMNLFIERGVKLLKKSGNLGFITNKTLAVLPSYKSIRNFILQNTIIKYVINNLAPFEAIVDCTIIGLLKEEKNSYMLKYYSGDIEKYLPIDVDGFLANRNYEFHYSKNNSILEKMMQQKERLGNVLEINRGVNIGGCFSDFLSNEIKPNYYKYIAGTKGIKKYSYEWNKTVDCFFTFDQEKEKELRLGGKTLALGNPHRYLKPRLFIPESSQTITSAYCDELIYAGYGIMVGTIKNKLYNLKFLCGLLNSKIITFFCLENEILRKGKKATPHIGVKGLNSIPIPSFELQQSLIDIVDQILKSKRDTPDLDTSSLEQTIDIIVYKMYGLTYDEVKIIDSNFFMKKEDYENLIVK